MAPRGPPSPSRMHGIRSEALRGLDPMIRVLAADASESVTSRGPTPSRLTSRRIAKPGFSGVTATV